MPVQKYASFGRTHALTAAPVQTGNTIFCAHPCVPSMGPFGSERGYSRRCGVPGCSKAAYFSGLRCQNASNMLQTEIRIIRACVHSGDAGPEIRIFQAHARSNNRPGVNWKYHFLCTPVCTIDGTLRERARKYASFGRTHALTAAPVQTGNTIFCAHPCVPSMGPFGSEREYTRRCGVYLKRTHALTAAPVQTENTIFCAHPCVPSMGPFGSERGQWPARDARKQHIALVFNPKNASKMLPGGNWNHFLCVPAYTIDGILERAGVRPPPPPRVFRTWAAPAAPWHTPRPCRQSGGNDLERRKDVDRTRHAVFIERGYTDVQLFPAGDEWENDVSAGFFIPQFSVFIPKWSNNFHKRVPGQVSQPWPVVK
eukprot:gene22226-biopygen10233